MLLQKTPDFVISILAVHELNILQSDSNPLDIFLPQFHLNLCVSFCPNLNVPLNQMISLPCIDIKQIHAYISSLTMTLHGTSELHLKGNFIFPEKYYCLITNFKEEYVKKLFRLTNGFTFFIESLS